uniref:Transposase n=1 Tax=Heterorhabditis bacteriophora TaxID=37862 RepID=A0A1I7WN07_HETBA
MRQTTMSESRTADAILLLGQALEECGIENQIASYLKRKFDEKHGQLYFVKLMARTTMAMHSWTEFWQPLRLY